MSINNTKPAATLTINLANGRSYTFSVEDARSIQIELNRIFSSQEQLTVPEGYGWSTTKAVSKDFEDLPF